MTELPQPGSGLRRDLLDAARDEIGRRLEAEFPGWNISHGLYGWTATRPGWEPVQMVSSGVLASILASQERHEKERQEQERERAERIRDLARCAGVSEEVIAARLSAAGL